MSSSTLRYAGMYQELADAAREITKAPAVVLNRLDHDSMRVRTVAAAPPGAALPRGTGGAGTTRRLRQVSLPLRTRRGVTGTLVLFTARRARASERRRYEGVARLVALALELNQDAQDGIGTSERVRRDAAAGLHGTHAALIALRHRLGTSRELRAADPAQADAVLETVRDELERICERDIGRTGRSLYPLAIRMSLTPALEALAGRYAPDVKIALRVDAAVAEMDDPFRNRLPEELRLAVYRVTEGAICRAASGRRPAPIDITLARSAGPALVLRVRQRSTGRGGPAGGLGRLGDLALRVTEWGGMLSLARRGGWTTLSVSVPVPAPDAPARPATPRNPA